MIHATVTLLDSLVDEPLPQPERAAELAHVLDKQGFNVVYEGMYGVSVEGEREDFERVFGVSPEEDGPFSAEITDSIDELKGVVGRIDVAGETEYF
ncbi:hypothetical protein [Paraburkholderia aspalathi]|uniref:Uncharacterized protein n=1 Tax=Paraburkholderia aspalathi TaxID=1324617 RepID=A0A1I7CLQ5_9BURK|nr:hypothetical protein [Paraburkholderia aspalathi]SFU00367.1 hypothetical protein SAMN05192563_10078 [Paraburkholderia aspalathi]